MNGSEGKRVPCSVAIRLQSNEHKHHRKALICVIVAGRLCVCVLFNQLIDSVHIILQHFVCARSICATFVAVATIVAVVPKFKSREKCVRSKQETVTKAPMGWLARMDRDWLCVWKIRTGKTHVSSI